LHQTCGLICSAPPKLSGKRLGRSFFGSGVLQDCSYTEAACVCLDRHHEAPILFELADGGSSSAVELAWSTPDERIKNARANVTDTTESGAYGVVLAAIETSGGLVAIHRAGTRTGADYYVAPSSRSTLHGGLRAFHLDQDWIEIVVDGTNVRIHGLSDTVDDVIGPMVNHLVEVDVDTDELGKKNLGGLHESVLETGPTGREMRPRSHRA
jgi:hypothetical protein